MKKAKDLMPELANLNNFVNCEISSLHLDSREVKEGGVFFAVQGTNQNGKDFIEEAKLKGAKLIISEDLVENSDVIHSANLKELLGKFTSRFYSNPSKELTTFCATGTNGKTTAVESYSSLCRSLGKKCGYLSTVRKSIDGITVEEPSPLTTPDVISLNTSLSEMLLNGASHAALEASSHGLDQGRLSGLSIDYAVLTSFSQDHLDYHKSIESYAKAKSILFKDLNPKNSIVQIDSEFGRNLHHDLLKKENSLQISLKSPYGVSEFDLNTVSRFIVSNVICSMVALNLEGIEIDRIAECASNITFPPGRMEGINIGKDICYIDYAHTPEALKQSLREIKNFHGGEIWCIFGCGGNRDKEKRPIMGQIAEHYSDYVVLTDDNPRNEDSKEIIKEILQGTSKPSNIKVISNRREAIKFALDGMSKRKKMNVLLLAGKGHEGYQIIGSTKNRFDDKETLISLAKN